MGFTHDSNFNENAKTLTDASHLIQHFLSSNTKLKAKLCNNIQLLVNHFTTTHPYKKNALSIDLHSITRHQEFLARKAIHLNKQLLANFQAIQKKAKEKNRKESCDFNMLRLFDIGETMHSFLLAHMLNPNADHGQGFIFLRSFLRSINIEEPDRGQWVVTAEKGRVDILLKRVSPHSVVIIENKSNNAPDRENQLYRYWYQEIYHKHRHREKKNDSYSAKHPEKYKVVYLAPTDAKQPSLISRSKPKGWSDELPDFMPIEPMVLAFRREVVDWLTDSLKDVFEGNHRLREYIKQYIEYWQ